MSYQDYPPHLDEIGVVEIIHNEIPYAWDVDGNVWKYTGETTQRKDGFVHVGVLAWEEILSLTLDVDVELEHNERRLHDYLSELK
jgi:hypothetical protein